MAPYTLRPMNRPDWQEVAELIYVSTNDWYLANGRDAIFAGPRDTPQLFCSVYEQLDAGCCILAIDDADQRIVGSCFYHPRSTHVSLGIMNVHPEYFGQGIARRLLKFITDFADEAQLPVRLVSSAVNLDSFSLYNRAGFVPRTVFQDMILKVPADGITDSDVDTTRVREATLDDVPAMAALERDINHIEREKDYRHFVENSDGIWHVTICESRDGAVDGFLASVFHPASRMLGPGIARCANDAIALILNQLNHHRGRQPVWLVPSTEAKVVEKMYAWGARNCELHFAQCRGAWTAPNGIVMPTFMPETG